MNIGIIIHSKTGFTLGFGQRIASKLREQGHTVDVITLKTDGPVQPRSTDVVINNIPDCQPFDALLVGGPVWAFAASPVILACIKALRGISGKKILPFVTMGSPFPFMGGTQAIAQISSALTSAGATVLPGTIIPKLFRNVTQLMDTAASAIPASFA
jgi:flavorubredoxin